MKLICIKPAVLSAGKCQLHIVGMESKVMGKSLSMFKTREGRKVPNMVC